VAETQRNAIEARTGRVGRRTVLQTGVGVLAGGLVAGTASAQSSASGEDWPTQGFGPGNASYNPDGTPVRSDVVEFTRVDVGAAHRGDYLLADGTLYVHSTENALGAVDVRTNELRWRYAAADAPVVPTFADDSLVGARSLAGPLYGVDPSDGSDTNDVPLESGRGLGVDGDGRWFAPLEEGAVVAGEASESGRWRTAVGGVPVRPAVADGRVFVSVLETPPEDLDLAFPDETINNLDAPGRLYAMDADEGEILWEAERVGAGIGAPAVENGLVYWTGGDGDVLVHDAETGERVWEYKTDGAFHTSPAVADGTVFAGNEDGNLYALDAATGEEVDRASTDAAVRGGPMVVDDVVYWGNQAGTVTATAVQDGNELWQFQIEGPVRAMAAGYGRVVVGTDWAYWLLGEDGDGGDVVDGGSDGSASRDGSPAKDAGSGGSEPTDRKRGLLSNGGDEPEFMSDGLNLTVLGFVLSVVGILHQMTQGR
jgi:outer membrane protein assembly factor BamB